MNNIMSIKLIISGACGRMGRSIAALALRDPAFSLGAALEAPKHDAVGRDLSAMLGSSAPVGVAVTDDAEAALGQGDVVVEFTVPEVTIAHVELAKRLKKPMVIGTTGLSEAQHAQLRAAASAIPIVFSANMSLGVNVLFELVQAAATHLGPGYDVEVIEAHHRHKQDAPSGTAKRLAAVLATSRRQRVDSIPVHAIRAGEIVGDHTVVFAGPSERLELTHRAQSREVFAQGALRAAQFVVGHGPGLYDMSDVLSMRV